MMFDKILIPISISFTIGTILAFIVVKIIQYKKYMSATKKISATFVGWEDVLANPKYDIKFYYPVFEYEYQGKFYKNKSIKGWKNKVPILYSHEYPVWINPENPDIITIDEEEFQKYF